jgi:tellurite resistance protein TehA-like permease
VSSLPHAPDRSGAAAERARRGWWGFTFPLGTLASAAGALGAELGTPAWTAIGATLSAAVVLLWAYVAARTAVEAVRGSVL